MNRSDNLAESDIFQSEEPEISEPCDEHAVVFHLSSNDGLLLGQKNKDDDDDFDDDDDDYYNNDDDEDDSPYEREPTDRDIIEDDFPLDPDDDIFEEDDDVSYS